VRATQYNLSFTATKSISIQTGTNLKVLRNDKHACTNHPLASQENTSKVDFAYHPILRNRHRHIFLIKT
jgi:hypothetical protein